MSHKDRQRGFAAEQDVLNNIIYGSSPDSPWGTIVGPGLDYGGKTDVIAVCGKGVERPVQVSVGKKSRRTRERLGALGITPITNREVASGSVHQTICAGCPHRVGCESSYSDDESAA